MMKKQALVITVCLALLISILPLTVLAGSGDDYPSNLKSAAKDSVVDPWNFYNRECTSFAAWCLNSRNGVGFTNQYLGASRWGNAKTWGTVASSLGVLVDKNPAVGAIAWWNTGDYGHVAWVSSVNGSSVVIEEYNYASAGNYGTRTINSSNPTGYIHIKDLDSKPPLSGCPQVSVNYGYYKLQFDGTKYLDIAGNLMDSGTQIWTYSSVMHTGQTFEIGLNWNNSGYYMRRTGGVDRYVTTESNRSGESNVCLLDGNGNDGQQWIFEDAGNGYVYVRNLYGYYLTVEGGVNKDLQNVLAKRFDGSKGQKWKLIRISGQESMSLSEGYYRLQFDGTKYLDIAGNLMDSGTQIWTYSSVQHTGQTFYIGLNWNGSGYYMRRTGGVDRYVTTESNNTGESNVCLLDGNGNDGQQWIFENAGNGYVYVRNLYGYYLTVEGGVNKDLQNVLALKYDGSKGQKWKLISAEYKIKFNANGGTGAPTEQRKVYGESIKLSTSVPDRDGFFFKKWNTKPDGTGKDFQPGAEYSLEGTATLYAIWDNKSNNVAPSVQPGSGNQQGANSTQKTIIKKANPLKVKVSNVAFKRSKLKKAKKFSIGVSEAQGKVTYTLDKKAKKAKIRVTAKGKVLIPKKCKKGTYKITVKAAGNQNYKAGTKTVTIKIK